MGILERLWNSFSVWAMGWGGLAGLVGVCLLALWFFTPPWLSSIPARAFLLNAALTCIAFAVLSAYFLKEGYDKCVAEFAQRDKAAVERRQKGEEDVALCRAAGRDWDVVTGTCKPKTE